MKFEVLVKRIIEVYDKSGSILDGKFTIGYYKSKYSSFDGETIRLFLDSIPLSKEGYKVLYECKCGCKNLILLQKYLLRNENSSCNKCRELDSNKKLKQSNYMKKSYKKTGRISKLEVTKIKLVSVNDRIKNSEVLFNNENYDYKEKYFKINTTIDEFNLHKDSIISINGIDIKNLDFIPYLRIKNHIKFSQYVRNKLNDEILKFTKIDYMCDSCNKKFHSSGRRLPKEKLSRHKILCKDCGLCNNTFRVRNCENIEGNRIVYQSKPEYELINYCNSNNIIIKNGPYLGYFWNDKKRVYRVDFEVNNILIEVKDNHIWHRNQVKSGQWSMKEKVAIDYCNESGKEFKLLFKNDIMNIQDIIKI